MNARVRYDDLSALPALAIQTSWGLLPPSEGTLSFITPEAIVAASATVTSGEVIALSLGSQELDPPLFGRSPTTHVLTESARNIFEDDLSNFNPQSGSQWDGLMHIRAREFGHYSGVSDIDEARDVLGMHHWGLRGIVGRGVLVDVKAHLGASWDPFAGDTVGVDVVGSALEAQGSELREGDILCLRLGWVAEYRRARDAGEDLSRLGDRFSGLASTDDVVRFLWDGRVAAVVADNPAVESAPGDPANGSLHRKLIPGLGFAVGELFDLDALAVACARRSRYDFLFTAAPMTTYGLASSTANALAIL